MSDSILGTLLPLFVPRATHLGAENEEGREWGKAGGSGSGKKTKPTVTFESLWLSLMLKRQALRRNLCIPLFDPFATTTEVCEGMHIYMYICVCIYIYMYVYLCICMYISYICMYISYMYIYMYMYVYVCTCIYVCMYETDPGYLCIHLPDPYRSVWQNIVSFIGLFCKRDL